MNIHTLYITLSHASLTEQIHGYKLYPEIRSYFDNDISLWAIDTDEIATLMISKNTEYLSFIIQKIPIINAQCIYDKDGDNLLFYIVRNGSLSDIKKLLRYNGSLSVSSMELIESAIERGDIDIFKIVYLYAWNDDNDVYLYYEPLSFAIRDDALDIVDYLIDKIPTNKRKEKCYSDDCPLIVAVDRENIEIIHKLLDAGFNIESVDRNEWTPLMIAVDKENISIIDLLLQEGANPNVKNGYGDTYTPLRLALEHNRPDIARIIIKAGGINDTYALNYTLNNPSFLKELLESGVGTSSNDKEDLMQIYDEAIDNGKIEAANIIKEYL